MSYMDIMNAVNTCAVIESEEKRRGVWCKKPPVINLDAFIDPMPVSLLSDDPFIAIDQMDLWREGKREEAIALKNK